jgi:hypothetical protein
MRKFPIMTEFPETKASPLFGDINLVINILAKLACWQCQALALGGGSPRGRHP